MEVTDMVAGQQVLGVSGPGGSSDEMRTGKVVEIVTDRWGTHAVAAMDDGSTAHIHSLNGRMAVVNGYPRVTSGCGIGWYVGEVVS